MNVPFSGRWNLWLRGEIMPALTIRMDGRVVATISGLGGDDANPLPLPPVMLRLRAGQHRISITRDVSPLSPGDGGSAFLHAALLSPAANAPAPTAVSPAHARAQLCYRPLSWVEVVPRRR